jgi:hypothetical protein
MGYAHNGRRYGGGGQLSQLATNLILSCSALASSEESEQCHTVVKMLVFRLRETGDFGQIQERVQQLLTEWDAIQPRKRRDWRRPMQRHITLLVNVVALDPFGATGKAGVGKADTPSRHHDGCAQS